MIHKDSLGGAFCVQIIKIDILSIFDGFMCYLFRCMFVYWRISIGIGLFSFFCYYYLFVYRKGLTVTPKFTAEKDIIMYKSATAMEFSCDPLSPDAIKRIKESMKGGEVDAVHIFVIFGASVCIGYLSIDLIYLNLLII